MKKYSVCVYWIHWLILFLIPLSGLVAQGPLEVRIVEAGDSYALHVNGAPYFIKGAVGRTRMAELKAHGANSVRLWSNHQAGLDEAHRHGMTALVSLPIRAERRGMDYDDPIAVEAQFHEIMALVESLKQHPALLMWAVGNELDFVPGSETYKKSMWDAVNDLVEAIQATDPNHPVMTVVGSGRFHKILDVRERVPALDLLGVNTYADMEAIPARLSQYGWTKPFVFTEWGVSGYWQVPKTAWGAPYEENTSKKAAAYRRKYETVVLGHAQNCLGEYVFLWGWKQETTHTWFGLFDDQGRETEGVDVMHELWTGHPPENRAPSIEDIVLEGKVYLEDITTEPEALLEASVQGRDPDGDPLTFHWEIRPEAIYADYAGQGEKQPPALPGLIQQTRPRAVAEGEAESLTFRAPHKPGAYRLFVYISDNHHHVATANKPFLVTGSARDKHQAVTDYGKL